MMTLKENSIGTWMHVSVESGRGIANNTGAEGRSRWRNSIRQRPLCMGDLLTGPVKYAGYVLLSIQSDIYVGDANGASF